MATAKKNGLVLALSIITSIVVLIVGAYAVIDTTEQVKTVQVEAEKALKSHDTCVDSHMDLRKDVNETVDSIASVQKVVRSIEATQDSMRMEQQWFKQQTFEKLELILKKVDDGR